VRRRALPAFAAIDFLSCLLVVFVAVAVTSKPPEVKTYGSYAVAMTWPAGEVDVDLYMRDPAGSIAYFKNMQVDAMQLEHDDLGTAATNYGAGKPNHERTVLRSTTPGQYVVGVDLFARGNAAGVAPVPVSVELWDLRGDDHVLKSRTVYVTRVGDQRTPFRFNVDGAGNVTGYSYLPADLVHGQDVYAGAG
jgi:hypothetical protein